MFVKVRREKSWCNTRETLPSSTLDTLSLMLIIKTEHWRSDVKNQIIMPSIFHVEIHINISRLILLSRQIRRLVRTKRAPRSYHYWRSAIMYRLMVGNERHPVATTRLLLGTTWVMNRLWLDEMVLNLTTQSPKSLPRTLLNPPRPITHRSATEQMALCWQQVQHQPTTLSKWTALE